MAPVLDDSAIVLVLALILTPGLGLAFALLPPGSAVLPVRIALGFAFGYAALGLAALGLAAVHTLTLGSFLAAVGVITLATWIRVISRLPQHLRALRIELADTWTRHVPFLVVLAGTVVVRATYAPLANLAPTTLRYWSDGLEIADTHGFPEATLQWGRPLVPTTSKAILNAFQGSMSYVIGRDTLVSTGVLLFVISIALVFLAYAIAQELGFRWLGAILPVALFVNGLVGNTELTSDLRQNLAENWGRSAMFGAVVLAIRALKGSNREGARPARNRLAVHQRDALLAGVLFGVAAGTHLVAMAVGLAFAASYAIMRAILDQDMLRVLRVCGIGLATTALAGLLLLAIPRGDLGFGGATGDAAYVALREDLGLPPTFDPTYYLVFGDEEAATSGFVYSPGDVLADFTNQMWNRNRRLTATEPLGRVQIAASLGLAALGVLILFVFGDADLRAVAGTAVILVIILLFVGVGFAARSDLYVMETFANRRLFNYTILPFALLAIGVGDLLVRVLERRTRNRVRWIPSAVSTAVCLSLSLAMMPSAVADATRLEARRSDLELVTWATDHAGCMGRILADRRTLATFESLGGRVGVVEGMGPHVRPDVLAVALEELFEADRFFSDPASGLGYLRDRGVAYVVSTNPGHEIGGWQRIERGRRQLDKATFLRPVFENASGVIYEVDGFEPDPTLPDPAQYPVYCQGGE